MKDNCKKILDEYATEVCDTTAIYEKNGKAGLNANKSFSYNPERFSDKICLWKAPNSWIRIEFDGVTQDEVKPVVSEVESNLKALKYDYCITYHKGGVSPYINICNIEGIPLNEDNKPAKLLLLDEILSGKAKKVLDKGNLSFTWTPVIGNQHWKPKYNGAIHEIKKGKNPLEQKNEYPKHLLSLLKKSKKVSKKNTSDIIRSDKWVEDFLLNYCCENELPEGQRHLVINKNLGILIANREDQEEIIEKYNKVNGDAGSIRGWIISFQRGNINHISAGELRKYIIDNNISYDIKDAEATKVEGNNLQKAIQTFTNKRNLAEQFIKIQPLFYDEIRNFWIWNHLKKSWERKDDVHMCNLISHNSFADTINSKERNEILEALKQVGRLHHPKPFKKEWIQFEDCIVDIKTGDMFDSTPDYFCTNPIPYSLSDTGETPVMDSLFEEWVGKKYVDTLKEVMAYCMLSDYPIHRIFCFLGTGRNGKSKYLKLIKRIIGQENCCSVRLDELFKSRFEMFNLYKKLVCQMGETNFSTISKSAVLKELSGQDTVSFEAKNKDAIQGENYAKLLISTNNLPPSDDKTDGFYRRWIVVDFPNEFPEGNDVLDIIPDKEYNNFCYASIEILRNLLKKGGFKNEGSIEERKKSYEDRSNPLDKFIKEFCVEEHDEVMFTYEFRKRFKEWCEENKFRQLSEVAIGKKMKEKGFEKSKSAKDMFDKELGRFDKKYIPSWIGLGWKDTGVTKEFVKEQIEITEKKVNEVQMSEINLK